MTIQALIEELAQYAPELEVIGPIGKYGYGQLTRVEEGCFNDIAGDWQPLYEENEKPNSVKLDFSWGNR